MNSTRSAYITLVDSPIGLIAIGYKEDAILCLHIGEAARAVVADTLKYLKYTVEDSSLPLGKRLEQEILAYLDGKLSRFSVPPEFHGTPFQVKVWQALCQVPYGKTVTYGELAAQAGRPGAARAVGMIMGQNRIPLIAPCHRVVGANGSLTRFGYGLEMKRRLLELEGWKSTHAS